MRREREEESKMISPMFPRLHVNDADKGGPRAPPRNKMALYEQLSIPSQRFKRTPFPPSCPTAATAVPSASSSQGGYAPERSILSSYYSSPQAPYHPSEETQPRPSYERNSTTLLGRASSNASVQSQSSARGISNSTNSCRKQADDDDDFRVPTFIQHGGRNQNASDVSPCHTEFPQSSAATNHFLPTEIPKAHESPPEHPSKLQKLENPQKRSSRNEQRDRPASHLGPGEKFIETHIQDASYNHENVNSVVSLKNSDTGSKRNRPIGNGRCLNDVEIVDPSRETAGYGSKTSNCDYGNIGVAEDNRGSLDRKTISLDSENMDKNDDASDTSVVDSDTGLDISPDDVVGVIGPKHFWKARRAIVNQQRVFAVQVFELHRLIKVQKLIAASPDILLEGNPYLWPSPSVKSKNNSCDNNEKSQPQIVKPRGASGKVSDKVFSPGNLPTTPSLPLTPQVDGSNKTHSAQVPPSGPYCGNMPPIPMTSDGRPNPWCFPMHGNQWLIPVMSPSEGLVYKPYMGPYPLPSGFPSPINGGCPAMAMPPVNRDFMNAAAYGFPTPHHQQSYGLLPSNRAIVPSHFPTPYGLPGMNPVVPSSTIEQAKSSVGPQSNGHVQQQPKAPQYNGHVEQPAHGSCNAADPKSEAFSGSRRNVQASKENELHGSSASSPSEKAQERTEVLPLISETPDKECSEPPPQSHGIQRQTRVIKVVPHHNASIVNESVARIFRSIQQEKQQYD